MTGRSLVWIAVIGVLGAVIGLAIATWSLLAPQHITAGSPPADIRAERVAFDSPSGSRIAGWFVPGRAGQGAVIVMHGVRSSRVSMIARMRWLAAEGYAVLAFDFQAQGESPGRFITFGKLEALDAAAAVAMLRARLPGERIGAIGASLGGAAALLGPSPLGVDALVLEAVYPDIRTAIANRLEQRLGTPGRRLAPILELAARWITGLTPAELQPIARIGSATAPLLLAVGAEDRHTTLADTRAMLERAAPGTPLWIVPGAAHVDLHAAAPAEYVATVGPFLARYLR